MENVCYITYNITVILRLMQLDIIIVLQSNVHSRRDCMSIILIHYAKQYME